MTYASPAFLMTFMIFVACTILGCANVKSSGMENPGNNSTKSEVRTDTNPSLGVIRLDYEYPPVLGDVDFPGGFSYPVVYEVVEGLTFERCQKGEMDPELAKGFKDAVRQLEARGAAGISGDCGFMMNYQEFIRNQTDLPVFMSSIMLAPTLMPMLNPSEKIAILTANSVNLKPGLPGMLKTCGLEGQIDRFVVVGCEKVPGFEAVANAEKVDVSKVMPGIENLVLQLMQDHPEVKILVFECTELGAYSNRVRALTGLPVFDAISNMNFFQAGLAENAMLP